MQSLCKGHFAIIHLEENPQDPQLQAQPRFATFRPSAPHRFVHFLRRPIIASAAAQPSEISSCPFALTPIHHPSAPSTVSISYRDRSARSVRWLRFTCDPAGRSLQNRQRHSNKSAAVLRITGCNGCIIPSHPPNTHPSTHPPTHPPTHLPRLGTDTIC